MQTLSQRLGQQEPTASHRPADAVTDQQAEDAVALAQVAGLELLDWQADFLTGSLMRRRGDFDKWAATECAIVVPRQNGKGGVLEARQLAGLFVTNEGLQLHTAHEFKTAQEHFIRIKNLIEATPLLMKQVRIIRTGAGEQGVELKNGCRLKFLARNKNSARGFSADTIYLDEAFELDDDTMGAILPTLMARPNPQIWYTSSAPHKHSPVLRRMIERGKAGDEARLMFAEWANDPDVDPLDRDAWVRANPSLGYLIDIDRIAMAQSSLDPEEFAREHLGVPEAEVTAADVPIPLDVWESLTDGQSMATDESVRLALDVSPDRQWATFGVAGIRSDGLRHVAVRDRQPGVEWVAQRAAELAEGHGTPVIIAKGSPGAALIDSLTAAGVPVDEMSTADYAASVGRIIDSTRGEAPELRHRGDPNLRLALAAVKVKPHGDGGMVWSRRTTATDITPLTTSTMAFGRLDTLQEPAEYLGGVTSLEDWLED